MNAVTGKIKINYRNTHEFISANFFLMAQADEVIAKIRNHFAPEHAFAEFVKTANRNLNATDAAHVTYEYFPERKLTGTVRGFTAEGRAIVYMDSNHDNTFAGSRNCTFAVKPEVGARVTMIGTDADESSYRIA